MFKSISPKKFLNFVKLKKRGIVSRIQQTGGIIDELWFNFFSWCLKV